MSKFSLNYPSISFLLEVPLEAPLGATLYAPLKALLKHVFKPFLTSPLKYPLFGELCSTLGVCWDRAQAWA